MRVLDHDRTKRNVETIHVIAAHVDCDNLGLHARFRGDGAACVEADASRDFFVLARLSEDLVQMRQSDEPNWNNQRWFLMLIRCIPVEHCNPKVVSRELPLDKQMATVNDVGSSVRASRHGSKERTNVSCVERTLERKTETTLTVVLFIELELLLPCDGYLRVLSLLPCLFLSSLFDCSR